MSGAQEAPILTKAPHTVCHSVLPARHKEGFEGVRSIAVEAQSKYQTINKVHSTHKIDLGRPHACQNSRGNARKPNKAQLRNKDSKEGKK